MQTTTFKPVLNPLTGQVEQVGGAILRKINTAPRDYTNAAGEKKQFYLATIDFVYPSGKEALGVTAGIPAKNYDYGMELDQEYLTTIRKGDDNKLYATVSHLVPNGNAIEVDEFSFELEGTPVSTAGLTA